MIFAIIDYVSYRNKNGRYSLEIGKDIMCGAFVNEIPKPFLDMLKPGNVILHSDFNSVISWLIMFLTKSQVSHASVYAGNGMVLHTGLSGVMYEPVEKIFGEDTRLLPLVYRDPNHKVSAFDESILGGKGRLPYPVNLVLKKAVYIILGRNGRFYSFKLFLDSLLIVSLIAWLVSFAYPFVLVFMIGFFFLVIGVNLSLSIIKPLPFGEEYGAPCDALRFRALHPLFNIESSWLKRSTVEANA